MIKLFILTGNVQTRTAEPAVGYQTGYDNVRDV